MLEKSNPLAGPEIWNTVSAEYTRHTASHLSKYADDALRLAEVKSGMRIVDIACGPGSLSIAATRLGARAYALDFASDMIVRLKECAQREGVVDIEACVGDGMALPYGNELFDAAFSMFGLMFFPDRKKGFSELFRILKPSGRAAVGSWLPSHENPVFSHIYGTIAKSIPDLPFGSSSQPLSNVGDFEKEMTDAGFDEVAIHKVSHVLESPSMEEFWQNMQKGTPSFEVVRLTIGDEKWTAVSGEILGMLQAKWGNGPQRFEFGAFLGVGKR